MEEWELRYLHEKAMRDSQCVSRGIEIPEDPEYGTLAAAPTKLFMKFIGKKFWKEMDDRGHDMCEFARCKCQKI